MNRELWMNAMESAGVTDREAPDAVTINEFAEVFSLKRETAKRRLELLVSIGMAEKVAIRKSDAIGRRVPHHAYRLLERVHVTQARTGNARRRGRARRG